MRRYRGGRRRSGLVLGEKKRGNGIKRSVETSGVPRLHRFAEPPCYYTDYIFKCAYPECALSLSLFLFFFFPFSFSTNPPGLLFVYPLCVSCSRPSVLRRHSRSDMFYLFFRVSADFMTLSTPLPPRQHISRNHLRAFASLHLSRGVRRRSGGDSGGES